MKKTNLNTKSDRNYGIDLLRIISMIMVIILHILSHGGIWKGSASLTAHNETAWFLGIAAYCAVNIYALISGYVGYGKKHKYSNLLYLYLQVIFYTLSITVLFYFFKPEMLEPDAFYRAIFPFAYQTYWFFTAYFCLFFFMPFFDLAIAAFDKNIMQKLLVSMFIIFSLLPTLFQSDFPSTDNGFSFLWLAVMYITGAYIKKYDSNITYNNHLNLLGYFFCVILTWLSKVLIELVTFKTAKTPGDGSYLIGYVSPTIVFSAIFLLLFFSRMNCKKGIRKFIRFFAPVTFGIYLFHEEPLIRGAFISGAFQRYLDLSPLQMFFAIICTALAIGLAGSLADWTRLAIFNVLRIKQCCIHIEDRLSSFYKKIKN